MKNYFLTYKSSIKWAIIGMTGLSLFYFLVSALVGRSFTHPFEQFATLQPWITILILSFGIQVGLYKLLHFNAHAVGASGGVSGVSMVLCCVHHASDFLPVLGASGLGLMLSAYQKDFLILGVIINLFVIFYLLKQFLLVDAKIRYSFLATTAVVVAFGLISITKSIFVKASPLDSQTKQVGVVEIEVTPKALSHGKPATFSIKMDTHVTDLNYDFMKVVILVDSEGGVYAPASWSGGAGGHHLSGDLVFGSISKKAESVGLNIKGVDNQNAIFEWKLLN